MNKTLGNKRVLGLIVMALLVAGLYYVQDAYLLVNKEQVEKELAAKKSEIEAKRAEINNLKREFKLLETQLRDYKELETKGFFNDQNRVVANQNMKSLQSMAGLLKAKYVVDAGAVIDDQRAKDANHILLSSPIEVEIDSISDTDVFAFVKLLQERFPGYVSFNKIEVNLDQVPTPVVLRSIGSGSPIVMVKSKIMFDWKTMAPATDITMPSASEVVQ